MILLFIFSTIGFWEAIRKHTDIDVNFIPSLLVAAQTLCLFLSGIIGILWPVTLVINIFGILLFAVYLYKEGFILFNKFFNIGFLYLFLSITILFFY